MRLDKLLEVPTTIYVRPMMLVEVDFGQWDLYVARGRGWAVIARKLRPFRVEAP